MEKFYPVSEARITRAIISEFTSWLHDYVVSDVIIVGGGPSGLMAAYDLANKGVKTLVIESNNYLGGGFWVGGYFMNTLTFRAPSEKILEELNITFKKVDEGLFVSDGPGTCAKLIAAASDAGAKILNVTRFDDVVFRNGNVEGVVINWSPIVSMPRAIACLDPISLESQVVIDATGHDAHVCKALAHRGLLELSNFGPMDVQSSEDAVVEKTQEVFPGLLVCGMSVSTLFGIARMGPTFGSMLVSGRKVAQESLKVLKRKKDKDVSLDAVTA
ncbi:MAG: sulfide-dependent adenosine diphosphate thiazole synthase [Candidatus Omnitrophota bacterium]